VTGRVDPANQHGKNAMRIQVTATYKDQSQSLTRIVDGSQKARSTTEFALFVDEDLVVPSGKKLVLQGDLHSNRNVHVQPGGTLQVGGAVSASHQVIGSLAATLYKEQYGRLVPNDLPSLSELYTQATQLLVGNQILPFGLTLSNGTVYYVQGNLQLQGALRGSAIVVVEGNLDFTGNTSYADPDSLYVFFVEGNIRVPAGRSVVGLLISLDGDVVLEDRAQVRGGIIILDGSLQLQGESVIEHDPRINTNLFQELTKLSDVINGIPLIPIPIVP
jgi:formylmethanofuran dehydrogenase subunit C